MNLTNLVDFAQTQWWVAITFQDWIMYSEAFIIIILFMLWRIYVRAFKREKTKVEIFQTGQHTIDGLIQSLKQANELTRLALSDRVPTTATTFPPYVPYGHH